jgi:hypothetical protein
MEGDNVIHLSDEAVAVDLFFTPFPHGVFCGRPSSFTDPFITNSSEEPPAITVSTNHYQLVDSVKTRRDQSNKREVFYHSHDRIFKLDLDTSAVTAVSPTQHTTICHNVWNNFLIIGTTQELIVWNMHNITPDSLQAAPMCRQMIGCMVNSINFHATESGLRLLVACNTHHPGVIVYSFPEMKELKRMDVPSHDNATYISYCSVSPDGTKMIVVGDKGECYLYKVENDDYILHKTVAVDGRDNSHICGWSADSSHFALSAPTRQLVQVFGSDASPLWSFSTKPKQKRQGDMYYEFFGVEGAMESLRFSPKDRHILAFAGGKRFYVVNTSTGQGQTFMCGNDGNFVGVDFSECGRTVFVGSNTGIYEFGMKRKETLVDLCLDSIRANIVYWHEQKQIDWKRQVPDSLVDRLFFGHEPQTYVEQLKRMTQARAQAATSQARTDLDRLKGRKKKNKKPNCVVN